MRLRRDKIAVALEHKVLVYNFADLRLMHSIETTSNPSGLLALSPVSDHIVLACPGINCGQVNAHISVDCPVGLIYKAYLKHLEHQSGISSSSLAPIRLLANVVQLMHHSKLLDILE